MSLVTSISALATAIGTRIKSVETSLAGKQATLASGTNIKTVNGASLLGAGDISVTGSGSGAPDYLMHNQGGIL